MKEFLAKLGITEEGQTTQAGNYVIDIQDSDQYNKIFGKLDSSDLLEENTDSSVINVNVTNILYLSDDYALNLIADFKADTYRLVVTELEDE